MYVICYVRKHKDTDGKLMHDLQKHHRRSMRLKGYDYTQPGVYFVTVVAKDRACIFGEIVDAIIKPNDTGRIVSETWAWLASRYAYVSLDAFCLMPNHFHGILIINDDDLCRGASRSAPTKTKPLGRLIGAFKTVSTKRINEYRGTLGETVWQRNYYEHLIRNDRDLERVREYVQANPFRWTEDGEYHAY